jgi:hypothetical protein
VLQNLDKGVLGKRGAETLEPFAGKACSVFIKGHSDNGENSAKVTNKPLNVSAVFFVNSIVIIS